MTPIADAAQALAGLLRAAEEGGLPMPYDAAANVFAPHGSDHEHGGITLMVHELAELADWSTWLDSPIDDSVRSEGTIHHRVLGHAGPVPVRVTALVHVEAPCTCGSDATSLNAAEVVVHQRDGLPCYIAEAVSS